MAAADRPLGIVHVVDTLEIGGLERVVTDLAIAQHRGGARVAVFSLGDGAGFRDVLEAAGVAVVIGGKRGTLDRAVLRKLRGTARELHADVVHSHNFVPSYYAVLATLAMARGPVLVNTCHNMGTRLSRRRLRWLYRWSLRRTARVAMVGDQVRERLVAEGIVDDARAATVLNGIPAQRFGASASRRAAARAMLALDDDAAVIGCVGRLVALKNHRLLLDQVPGLAQRHPRLRVVLIGDGPLAAELRAQAVTLGIADRVAFAGARADVADLLPAFDVFALPSQTEGISIALLEACATSLAVVASAVGGNPEIVRDGETGLLVAAGDGPGLGNALARLLADAGQRERLGAAARAWVVRNASIDALRDNYAALYRTALGTDARRVTR